MKNAIIALAVVFSLGLLIFGLSRTERAQKTIGILGKIEFAIDAAERIESLIKTDTSRIDLLLKQQQEESDRKIDSLFAIIINERVEHIAQIEMLISDLPSYEIPEISYVHPDTYEECLKELQGSRQTGEQLTEIVSIQYDHIVLLEGMNVSQGVIIETQSQIIEIQRIDIVASRDAYNDILQEAKRQKWIGILIGIGGILIALGDVIVALI